MKQNLNSKSWGRATDLVPVMATAEMLVGGQHVNVQACTAKPPSWPVLWSTASGHGLTLVPLCLNPEVGI